MDNLPSDVPIIGQPRRVIVQDFLIVAPNMIEVIPNGLSMGDSVAHLRITNPMKATQAWVPVTEGQLDELGSMINQVLTQVNPQDYRKGAGNGIN